MKFKKVEKQNQKLTNFFPRRDSGAGPSSSQPQQPSSSQPRQSGGSMHTKPVGQKKATNNAPPLPDQEVISVSSGSTTKSHISISSGLDSSVMLLSSAPRQKTRSVMVVSPPRRSTRVLCPPATPSPVIPFKRSRSPSIQFMGMSQYQQQHPPATKPASSSTAPKPRTPTKRKKKFDNDSDVSPNGSIIMLRRASVVQTPTSAPPIPTRTPSALKSSTVINLTSSLCKSSSKRPQKRARLTEQDEEGDELVPSSQSDEHELAVPRMTNKDPQDIQESVNRWRQEAVSPDPSSVPDDWAMDIDAGIDADADIPIPIPDPNTPYSSDGDPLNLNSNQTSPHSSSLHSSEAEVCKGLLSSGGNNTSSTFHTTPGSPLLAAASASRLKTPSPDSFKAPLPATPVALDAKSKTEQIIAQIRANALAASASSQDETSKVLVYQELDDSSSSDEDDDAFMLIKFDKGKGKSVATSSSKNDDPFSSDAGPSTHPGPSSLHDRILSSSPPSRSSLGPSTNTRRTRTSYQPRTSITKPAPTNTNKKRKKAADPLDLLLKEKKLADKRGNGMDALKLAEESMDINMQNVEEGADNAATRAGETTMNGDLMDEAAARKAIEEGASSPPKSSSSGFSTATDANGVDESVLLGEDEAKLLGLKDGGRMKKILDSDRAKKGKRKEKVLGVKLWDDTPRPADRPIEFRKPEFPSSLVDEHPVLRLLGNAWRNWDIDGIAMLVDSGILASLETSKYVPLVPFLCEAAFSGHNLSTGDPAFRLLSLIWAGHFPEIDNFVSLLLSALTCLGASPAIVKDLGKASVATSNEYVNAGDRATVIYRLVSLSRMACRAGALSNNDVPDTVVTLLFIAMDPTSSAELKRDIMVAVDTICQSIKGDSEAASATELALCQKALKFAAGLTPINKAHFITFLSGGCGRTIRIARWLAHAFLVGTDVLSTENYSELPPISNLLPLLSPVPGSGGLFDILTNADTVDYEDLGYQVEILSIALSGIGSYVAEERRVESTASREANIPDSPRKLGKEKLPSHLDMARDAINVIHGKIVDTRAAHLDRSRTKAALQRLSMRIYYQQLAALKSGQRGGTRKIREYFAPTS